MRPSLIPEEEAVAMDARRETIMPPRNDLDSGIAAVEVLRDTIDGQEVIRIRLVPDEGDLERLAAGEPLWLTWMAPVLVPFSLGFADIVVPQTEFLHRPGCCACQEAHYSDRPEWVCPGCGHNIWFPSLGGQAKTCGLCRTSWESAGETRP